jgi:hypothetical protein
MAASSSIPDIVDGGTRYNEINSEFMKLFGDEIVETFRSLAGGPRLVACTT